MYTYIYLYMSQRSGGLALASQRGGGSIYVMYIYSKIVTDRQIPHNFKTTHGCILNTHTTSVCCGVLHCVAVCHSESMLS